ncbi:NACHT and WD repeat domain-containing protein 2-like isoform X3 [Acanthaster planci]|uniref:NACHT and WD repeat domain-containing protein 2-like isoform X3 n=1 Tax=Acanthaster planci TaxID=133434 RepID=A0A8B7ZHH1_ACAPL|nr:NACHT and WD repeat domain-containing protein 2-like isoform X3 [Acanthaster planci]XP_022104321.1 NACHT and WD repeat domain-containing protein 2-like isoform X3 [Acanthaster planci]XP_022104322.1 NACHT and WD repeat domain-containing protein 2-like isoform X3 [Acanthaster planci]
MGSTCSSSQSVNGETSNKNMGNRRSSHSSNEDKDKEKERDHRSSSNASAKTSVQAQQEKRPSNPPLAPPQPAESPPSPQAPTPGTAHKTTPQMSPAMAKPAGKSGAGSSLPDLDCYSEDVKNMLLGKVALVKCKPQAKMVRVYISAASGDSEVERNALMERVYPKLRDHCALSGYEFEAIDLFWGLWDSRLKDERFLDQCLHEIKYCQAASTGPNFMSLLNMKYERCKTPIRVLASAFDRLLKKVEEDEDRALLTKHYLLDSNSVPPVYLFQGKASEDEAEKICEILRICWGKEEKERYMASVSETEIDEGVFSPTSVSDAVIWLHRRFTRIDPNDDTASIYLDLLPGNKEADTHSHEQLAQLTKRMATKVNEGNFVKFDIPWSPKGLDPDGISTHAKYIDDICNKTQQMLTELIDRAVAERLEEDVITKKTHRRLHLELQQHTALCQRHCDTFHGQTDLLNRIRDYLGGEAKSPLILHGAPGSGKTALASMAVKLCSQVSPLSACVVRFVGATPESSTPNQLLRSTCEQIAYLYGEHISIASRGANRLSKDLPTLLKRVTEHRPLVVVLDGIDQFASSGDTTAAFNWIPDTLPSNVKMILTTRGKNFEGFTHLKNLLRDSANFVEVPQLSGADSTKMVDSLLKAHGRTLCKAQAKVLRDAVAGCPIPLYAKLACHVACTWHSYDESSSTKIEKDTGAQMSAILDRLERRYGKVAVGHSLGYLCLARDGVSDAEMNDLLSCDDAVLDDIYPNKRPVLRRAPTYLWIAICQELAPFLLDCVVDERCLRTWAHVGLRELASKRYLPGTQNRTQLHKNFVDYYQGRWAKSKKKPFVKEGGIEVLMDRYVLPQPANYGSYPNRRRYHELVYHALNSGEKKFADKYIWDVDWLRHKLEHCDIYRVMEDVTLAQSKDPNNLDLQLLLEFLQVAAYSLSTDGTQLFCQLKQRLSGGALEKKGSSHPKMQQLFKQAAKPPVCNFFPSRDCLRKLDAKSPEEPTPTPKPMLTGLFRVPASNTYMVSVASEEGEVRVWNITTQKCVRTLRNLSCPRDVRFIDSHRVVILCNRELLIFNLDTGSFETKLKGMMNQKMPYYAMSDTEHVVALSRNRMYVNMINVTSGDVVSTFKVGEDRFLNSLLVSANGHRCVCGDDTQKPSPLLVWDLSARKLVHDFRISQHEFVTRMAAISNDGHYVVSVIKELDDPSRNFIIVYDLQSGQQFKKWKPLSNTTCVAISSEGQCVVNGCEDCSLLLWDLSSGSLKYTLQGHTHPVDSIYLSEDGKRCLSNDSTQMDRSLRMWDLQQGVSIATFTPDQPISCCQISATGDCAVIGVPGQRAIITLWLRSKDLDTSREDKKPYGDASRAGNEYDMSNEV